MASSASRPYQQHGVFFPCPQSDPDAERPLKSEEWPAVPAARDGPSPRKRRRTTTDDGLHVAEKGFLLVKIIADPGVLLVQSEANGNLYILKLSQPGADIEEGDEYYEDPLDLRVSTWVDAPGILPSDVSFFNKLKFWQKLTLEDSEPVYALYFE